MNHEILKQLKKRIKARNDNKSLAGTIAVTVLSSLPESVIEELLHSFVDNMINTACVCPEYHENHRSVLRGWTPDGADKVIDRTFFKYLKSPSIDDYMLVKEFKHLEESGTYWFYWNRLVRNFYKEYKDIICDLYRERCGKLKLRMEGL